LKSFAGILILLFVIAGTSYSDILPAGKKKISYFFDISGIDKFQDYVFLAYPVNQSDGNPLNKCVILENSKPVFLSCKYNSPAIYAIKKDLFNSEDIVSGNNHWGTKNEKLDSFFTNINFVKTKVIGCYTFVDKDAEFDRVTVYYSVNSVDTDSLRIKKEKTIRALDNDRVIDEIIEESSIINGSENGNTAGYIYFSLPFLSLIAIMTYIAVQKMNKKH